MQEEKISKSAYFITLTYDTKTVHITQNGYMGLKKRDLQLFFKRLRKAHSSLQHVHGHNLRLKYYAVGEYGGYTFRPHYHVILFNADVELIAQAWQLGHIDVGTVTGASIGYTLKYISKLSKIPMHRNDDRQKEFSLMSKGLGLNYITDNMVEWHKADMSKRMYCNLLDGKKIAMPRYYKNKIYNKEELGFLKGEFERFYEENAQKLIAQGKVQSVRDRMEYVHSEFRKMSIDTKNKI